MKEYRYQTLEEDQDNAFENDSVNSDNYPSSFEELKYWIKREDMPDIGVFGLHIGTDSKKTGESGIFEENGEYIVYQNGYDGHKDILYQGPNEAFAVKQFAILFTKEKEVFEKIYKIFEEKKNKKGKSEKKQLIKGIAIGGIVSLLLFAVATVVSKTDISSYTSSYSLFTDPDAGIYYIDSEENLYHLLRCLDSNNDEIYVWCWLNKDAEYWTIYDENLSPDEFPSEDCSEMINFPDSDDFECSATEFDFYRSKIYTESLLMIPNENTYYIDGNGNLYHLLNYWDETACETKYMWCWLNKDAEYWTVYDENIGLKDFPDVGSLGVVYYPDSDDYKCSEMELKFSSSRIYKDYHNWPPYDNGYYLNNDVLYYYLDNPLYDYFEEFITCKEGWYRHDKESNTWEYLGTHDEIKEINEDLWYYFGYYEYYFDMYEKDFDEDHQPLRFEDTDFYENYLKDVEVYNRKTGQSNSDS